MARVLFLAMGVVFALVASGGTPACAATPVSQLGVQLGDLRSGYTIAKAGTQWDKGVETFDALYQRQSNQVYSSVSRFHSVPDAQRGMALLRVLLDRGKYSDSQRIGGTVGSESFGWVGHRPTKGAYQADIVFRQGRYVVTVAFRTTPRPNVAGLNYSWCVGFGQLVNTRIIRLG